MGQILESFESKNGQFAFGGPLLSHFRASAKGSTVLCGLSQEKQRSKLHVVFRSAANTKYVTCWKCKAALWAKS